MSKLTTIIAEMAHRAYENGGPGVVVDPRYPAIPHVQARTEARIRSRFGSIEEDAYRTSAALVKSSVHELMENTMLRRTLVLIALLVVTLALPISVGAAARKGHGEGTWKLADGTVVVLSKVNANNGQITPLSQGYWQSGCRYAAFGPGGTIYSYTIWQEFGSNGTTINYLPPQTYSATTDVGYQLTSNSTQHWWINTTHKDAAARGTWTFTQYVSGQPFRSFSGWTQVQDKYDGTWTCYSS